MTRKTNIVEPLNYHGNSNQSAPAPHPKSDKKQAKLGKCPWNKVITFFTQLVCTEPERGDGELIRSKKKVVSMYGELSDSDNQTPPSSPPTKPKHHHHRSEFKEVVFTLPDDQIANPRDAKLTIPITALPKPNECKEMVEKRTNVEILQELNDKGLVGDAPPSPVSTKPGGVSFEVRVTTVRPKTAKGQRVPRPPRRLESLKEGNAIKKRNEEMSAKIKEKMENATLKRETLQETLQQTRNEKFQKIKQAVEAIADASEKKKASIAEKMAEKEEQAEAVRQGQHEEQLHSQDVKKRWQELARKSNQLSLGSPGEMSPVDDENSDRISTYNGSDESLSDSTDYLQSVKREDKYDAFYDGPNQDTYMF